VVAIVDGTGDGTKARKAAADLAAAGLTVGSTTPDPDATTSAIRYAAAQETGARALAGSAGASGLLQKADVEHVTVVLGGKDPSALLNDLDTLAAACG
jgi:LytR cell envelope-related transcriptional attenuator